MKIAIIGYGHMGKTIAGIAQERGHEIVLTFGRKNAAELTAENLQIADVAIDFSLPETAFENIKICLNAGVPVVSGTTGWLDDFAAATTLCQEKEGAFFYASNYSVGVNIFMEINERLAQLMNSRADYEISMKEIHHTRKLDAPSGTAITLAQGIIDQVERKTNYSLEDKVGGKNIHIVADREGDVPGTHIIKYTSENDALEIKHEAYSRSGFAIGAVLAAEWIINKKGVFGMKDMLRS